jgi:transcriptional regulator with XRE-family HTH domain
MEREGINRTQLAEHLGVSKGYVSQLLNGNFDHKISKLVELALAIGLCPKLELVLPEDYDKLPANSPEIAEEAPQLSAEVTADLPYKKVA